MWYRSEHSCSLPQYFFEILFCIVLVSTAIGCSDIKSDAVRVLQLDQPKAEQIIKGLQNYQQSHKTYPSELKDLLKEKLINESALKLPNTKKPFLSYSFRYCPKSDGSKYILMYGGRMSVGDAVGSGKAYFSEDKKWHVMPYKTTWKNIPSDDYPAFKKWVLDNSSSGEE